MTQKICLVGCVLVVLCFNGGCSTSSFRPTDVQIFEYHFGKCLKSVEEFTRRLYAKNPRFEMDKSKQQEKLASIFCGVQESCPFYQLTSDEILTAAFAKEPPDKDRVYLLGLGLAKSIREAYGNGNGEMLWLGLQVELSRLESLYHNVSQVNWRLKTYKEENGELMFLTNAIGMMAILTWGMR